MLSLTQWALKYGVHPAALEELRRMMLGVQDSAPLAREDGISSEGAVAKLVRLEASAKGCILWRNNVGALTDGRGIPVRYGLANDSKAMNERVKSSDLIGVRPVLVEPHHVGTVIGQFLARETKAPGWTYHASEHELAQLKFIEIVTALGGDAAFTQSEGSI